MKIKVEFEHHEELPNDNWVCYCTDLKIVEAADTKDEAFEQFMISLKVLIAYENGIEL